jgi:hypothetical protein
MISFDECDRCRSQSVGTRLACSVAVYASPWRVYRVTKEKGKGGYKISKSETALGSLV